MLAEIVKLPLHGVMEALLALYFALLVTTVWRAKIVESATIEGGYRPGPRASRRDVAWGYARMILFARTNDGPLRVLLWLTRLAIALCVLVMLVILLVVASPYRMSLR